MLVLLECTLFILVGFTNPLAIDKTSESTAIVRRRTPCSWPELQGSLYSGRLDLARAGQIAANRSALYEEDCDGLTPLEAALVTGRYDIADLLVQAGYDVNRRPSLHFSIQLPDAERATRYLLRLGASPRLLSHGRTPAYSAFLAGRTSLAADMLAAILKHNHQQYLSTPEPAQFLHAAAAQCNRNITSQILSFVHEGSKSREENNRTALHIAVLHNCSEVVRELIDSFLSDIFFMAKDSFGNSAIDLAFTNNNVDIAKMILEKLRMYVRVEYVNNVVKDGNINKLLMLKDLGVNYEYDHVMTVLSGNNAAVVNAVVLGGESRCDLISVAVRMNAVESLRALLETCGRPDEEWENYVEGMKSGVENDVMSKDALKELLQAVPPLLRFGGLVEAMEANKCHVLAWLIEWGMAERLVVLEEALKTNRLTCLEPLLAGQALSASGAENLISIAREAGNQTVVDFLQQHAKLKAK